METIINDQIFTISKPTIIDRIRGYFERRRYMRRFNADRAVRNQTINEMIRISMQWKKLVNAWSGTMPNPLPLIQYLNRKYGYDRTIH